MRVRKLTVIATSIVGGLVLVGLAVGVHLSHFTTRTIPPVPVWLARSTDTPADRAMRAAEAEINRAPQQSRGYVSLAGAYMRKARETGDGGYYLRAETAVRRALQLQPGSVAGLRTLAWVQTGKHEFREALAT